MPVIEQDVPIESEVATPRPPRPPLLPRCIRNMAPFLAQWNALPELPVHSITIRDAGHPEGVVVTEDNSEFINLFTCAHDELPHFDRDRIHFEGNSYYAGNLTACGIVACTYCHNWARASTISKGFCATCRVMRLAPKRTPGNGWRKSILHHEDESPTFGFELELEAIRETDSWPGPQVWAEKVIRAIENHPPMVSTTDGSLSHGCEMVSHPMSLNYITANNDTLAKMFTELRKYYKAENEFGEHHAALHVHATNALFPESPSKAMLEVLNVDWVKKHRNFLVALSCRPSENFRNWCEDGYKYIYPRNMRDGSHENHGGPNACPTWECRGFSNHALFDSGTDDGQAFDAAFDLPNICEWIKAIAWMTHDITRFGLSPIQIMQGAGCSEASITWIKDFDGSEIAHPSLISELQRQAYKESVALYATRINGALVRIREGGVHNSQRSGASQFNIAGMGVASRQNDGGMMFINQAFNRPTGCGFYASAENLEVVGGIPWTESMPALTFEETPVHAPPSIPYASLTAESQVA